MKWNQREVMHRNSLAQQPELSIFSWSLLYILPMCFVTPFDGPAFPWRVDRRWWSRLKGHGLARSASIVQKSVIRYTISARAVAEQHSTVRRLSRHSMRLRLPVHNFCGCRTSGFEIEIHSFVFILEASHFYDFPCPATHMLHITSLSPRLPHASPINYLNS